MRVILQTSVKTPVVEQPIDNFGFSLIRGHRNNRGGQERKVKTAEKLFLKTIEDVSHVFVPFLVNVVRCIQLNVATTAISKSRISALPTMLCLLEKVRNS